MFAKPYSASHSPAPDGTFVHNLTKTQGASVISVTPMVMHPRGPAETVNNGCPRKDVGLSPTSSAADGEVCCSATEHPAAQDVRVVSG